MCIEPKGECEMNIDAASAVAASNNANNNIYA